MSLHTKRSPLTSSGPSACNPIPQRLLRAPLADPQQTPAMRIDLVNHGQEVVGLRPVAPVDLVHAQRFDAVELAMGQAPLHHPLHRAIDRLPTGLKDLCRLSPAQPPRPARQESHHRRRHRPLAVAPGNVLDDNAMLDALHPPQRVAEPGRDPPQRHKLPVPLQQSIIAGRWLLAHRAASAHAAMRRHRDLDPFRLALADSHTHVLVNKPNKTLHPVQNGLKLKLNRWSPRPGWPLSSQQQTKPYCWSSAVPRSSLSYPVAQFLRRRGGAKSGNPAVLAGFPSAASFPPRPHPQIPL